MLTKEQLEALYIATEEELRAQLPKSADPNKDDEWVPSFCNMCYSGCNLRVHRVDGVVVKIEGNPTANNQGKICPKGNSGIMRMYDPHRLRKPLKRTNPQKGIGVDPNWVEISWDEALDIMTEKLKEVKEKNPRNFMIGSLDVQKELAFYMWSFAYGGTLGMISGHGGGTAGGVHCGNGEHMYGEVVHGSFIEFADADLCKMLMLVGCSAGHEAYGGLGTDARRFAEARVRGMKLVVVDPRMGAAAAKATEWVPIRPGTDSALALGMINVLINELGIYDAKFIKIQTNGPYLVGPDGYHVKEKESGKPLVWDTADGMAKTYDDPSVKDFALEGTYRAEGVECRPAFQLLKDHVKKYSPERVEEITSVPKENVRRLANEWGEAASIGTTVTIDGKEYPYRPVAVMFYRGNQAHKHSTLESMALLLLPMIVGALDAPGGQLRMDISSCVTFAVPTNRMLAPHLPPGPDGMVLPMGSFMFHPQMPVGWPPQQPDMKDYFPACLDPCHVCLLTAAEPERYGFEKGDHVFLFHQTNPVFSMGDPKMVEKALQNSYVINSNIIHDETTELSDLIIPERTYLEGYNLGGPWSMNYLGLQVRLPAVKEPLYGLPDILDVLIELGHRLGFLYGEQGLNWWFNMGCSIQEPWALDLNRRYEWPEIMDHIVQSHMGDSKYDLEWFRRHGHRIRLSTAEEKYRPFGRDRYPLYSEFIKKAGDNLRNAMEQQGIPERMGVKWDFSDYQPLPDWKPGPIHTASPEYDFFAVNYKPVVFTFSNGAFNPFLMELAEKDPYYLKLWMNTAAAKKRGLKEGDTVWVESAVHRLQGVVTVSESIHPECVGIASTLGHWAKHSIASGKGMHFNALNPVNWEMTDFVSAALEGVTARVKVYKTT